MHVNVSTDWSLDLSPFPPWPAIPRCISSTIDQVQNIDCASIRNWNRQTNFCSSIPFQDTVSLLITEEIKNRLPQSFAIVCDLSWCLVTGTRMIDKRSSVFVWEMIGIRHSTRVWGTSKGKMKCEALSWVSPYMSRHSRRPACKCYTGRPSLVLAVHPVKFILSGLSSQSVDARNFDSMDGHQASPESSLVVRPGVEWCQQDHSTPQPLPQFCRDC
jgi:hypothetical protein